MNESAGKGERDAAPSGIVIGPGEGRTILGTDAITLIATVEETGGSIGVFEDSSSPGDGPPRHVHHGSDELFYLLEGEFLILVGERQERVSAGTYVFVPRGTVHAYKVIGTERGRSFRPSFQGDRSWPSRSSSSCARSVRRSRSVEQMNEMFAELNEKYDSEFVGPPL